MAVMIIRTTQQIAVAFCKLNKAPLLLSAPLIVNVDLLFAGIGRLSWSLYIVNRWKSLASAVFRRGEY